MRGIKNNLEGRMEVKGKVEHEEEGQVRNKNGKCETM